ncbi:MAG: FMN-binding negative transcriptional regulator, partial [Actinomycetota bacterium]
MLVPPKFVLSEDDAWGAVQQRVFGTLVVGTSSGFEATPLPWIACDDSGVRNLRGHISAANPLVDLLQSPQRGIILFEVADAYISPNWYPSKIETGKVVPTWNYVTVHCQGILERFEDPSELQRNVHDLTDAMEHDRAEPWKV